ncbi:VCBS repeat-containing protein [Bradyrhizobium japonicum USDA 38]|uniref:VCBS domain-containing protein n=1 Tax=Bradyrhizobium japonicum TaxID=375 RepID=UPI0003FD6C58|nr:VCBS domain-containing protein [Bradyrhizobium japonicum]MCS3894760.1 VCBS repeat-containing protein [Bradyrhizobium japonicum USDA 38]MCS3947275.1 VCBS repeat-containing protein [Bradyrhizobium japonicum]MCW2219895.1 VCBS repeat-containing protein [Bradyrhizobium japonicum]MCW2344509.1 VCBS repeat-containing protein [Bradyrhizobium japonicum]
MAVTSTAEHGGEREAAAGLHRRVKTAKSNPPDVPVVQSHERASAGRFGMLSLTALLFSMIKEVRAADPNATFLDDDTITYKDFAHGTFELTTKESTPRHIIVEDPGQTVVLSKVGSGLTVNQLDNSPTRMEELRVAQQEALENLSKGFGKNGSGTPPFVESLPLEPINFIAPSAPNALPPLQPIIVTVPDIITTVRTPPILNVQAGPLELDTVAFDVFTATRGTFSASSSSAALTFGISGGATGATALEGAIYDVSKTSSFGTLYLNSTTGAYAFVPDSGAINALKTPTTDTFVITVSDGSLSAQQAFTININGADDAAIISGTTTGSSVELGGVANAASGPPVTTGKLSDIDVDDPINTFAAVNSPTKSAHGYGTFTMTADGVWSYTLDQSNSAVQALNVGKTLTDTFTVTSIGGTPQLITITINGSNDAAIISGATTGTVTEAACWKPGTPIATGKLADTDVDNTPDSFTPVTSPRASDHGYGCFQMTADGVWTYTLDNTNCVVQALNAYDTLTDTFTVTTIDGTAQVVTITIHGTNDPAIIHGCITGSVTEPDCREHGKPTASGRLTDTDVDNAPNTFTPITCATRSAGGYGTFTMTAAGVWIYTLDTTNCAVQALPSCETLTDTFTVTTIDGTEQTIAITIHGADDHHHFGHAAALDAADPPHAAALPEHNTAAGAFAAGPTVAATTHDASTDGTGVSAESPDHGKIGTNGGCDTCHDGHEQTLLAGGSRDDHFVFASTSNSSAARPDIISGFKADSERSDLMALGALTLSVLALDHSSTTVPAHTIAWLYDSSANQTIVYVNPTDQSLSIGDSSLVEIHLDGFSTVQTSDFMLALETSGHAMAAEPANLEPGADNDTTGSSTTATSLSSGETVHERAALIDGDGPGQAAKASGCRFDADCDRVVRVGHTQFVQPDDTNTRSDAASREDVAPTTSHHEPPVNQLHHTAVAENRFVFDKLAPFEPARESLASKGSGPVTPSAVDPSIESGPDSIEVSHHENHLREHHHEDPIAENDLPRVASVHFGDSFHFKQHGSDGSGDIAPAPWHGAVEPYAIRDGALHGHHSELSAGLDDPSDPSGHHEHAGVVHGFRAASMPEASPPHLDPVHGAGSAHAHVPHDLIV